MVNKLGLIVVCILLSNLVYAQCEIDAGPDRNICPTESLLGAVLNGELINGDVVEFVWEAEYYEPVLQTTFYASNMLSDTAILQPTVDQHFERTVKYHLTGITSDNETCMDSVVLNFSDWSVLTIDKMDHKLVEDTIGLWVAAMSNWPHIQYEWSPNYMISDTTIENPKVWNDSTTFYDVVITDSLGCKWTDDTFEVYVVPVSTREIIEGKVKVYPIPSSDILNIEFDGEIECIQ
ncbi:MAG: hypothetical protein MK212_19590, partial [Saprospiraceae bacterium]|nr:hypothetical protein [Saprospiraceae bacterium]